jgi:hypothetical protein
MNGSLAGPVAVAVAVSAAATYLLLANRARLPQAARTRPV